MTEKRQAFVGRGVLGALTVICLCSVAVVPLLRAASPCTHDGGLHYFRTVALRHALENGIAFTRWLPDLAFGYGFPFFNYRAPLSYYLGLGLYLLGLPLPLALNLLYVVSILGSALGAYLLTRDLYGPQAGVLAAVAYAYAPYQLLDALVRGNAPEAVALAVMPFVLWTFRRLMLRGGRGWFLASVAALASLYLGHNISSLLFTPFLLAYLAVLWYVYRDQAAWKLVAAAFLLALGLTAFFWFPALAEKGYVQLDLTGATRNNDFHYNFLTLTEILAPPDSFDTSLMNPPLRIRLGAAQLLLGGAGLVLGLVLLGERGRSSAYANLRVDGRGERSNPCGHRSEEQRATLLFFAGCAALFVFMSTAASVWLWEHVPLLPFVQFPWRFVGRASLPLAPLAGAVLLPLEKPKASDSGTGAGFGLYVLRLLPPVLVVIVIVAAFPSTYPPSGYCPMESRPTIEDVHRYEAESGLVGVDPVGAYFPVWVEQRPQGSPLEADYDGQGAVPRFDAEALPEPAEILEADYGPNRARIVVDSPRPFRGRYLTFYFPGWRVWVDGERVEVTPSDPEGLLTFDVPAGQRVVTVRFRETPLRLAADLVSGLALLALLISSILMPPSAGTPTTQGLRRGGSAQMHAGFLVTAAALLLFKLTVVDRTMTPFRHPELKESGALPGLAHPLDQSYADGLTLMGYDRSVGYSSIGGSGPIPADGVLRVDLYWTVRKQPSRRYQTVVHLVGPDGLRWSPKDSFRPTDYQGAPPTTVWEPGRYALDSHEVEPLPGTPPGRYDIVLTVFDRKTLEPLSVLNESGQPAFPELVLGQVSLTSPHRHLEPEDLRIQHRVEGGFGPVIFLGGNVSRDEAAPGDPVQFTTFWLAEERPTRALTLHLELLGAEGSVVADYALPPAVSWHPTSDWRSGDVWRGQHLLHLPAALDTGSYTWSVSLAPPSAPAVKLSRLSVTAPNRAFTKPPVEIEIDIPLGNVATLLGADIEPGATGLQPGTDLTVTLFWRAEADTDISYRVFLHLIGPDGDLVAQSDGIPADWSRPTTGWLAGEIITDHRVLAVPFYAPPGDYAVQAGLYTSRDGRLPTPAGAGAVTVTTVKVEE